MKKHLKFLFFLFVPLSGFAIETKPMPNFGFKFQPYGSFKFGMQHYEYTEPNVMSISGPMYVLNGTFGVKPNPIFKADVRIVYAQDIGKNIYNGSLQNFATNETTPFSAKSADYYVGGVGRVAFIIGDGVQQEWVSLYTGLGYRFLANSVQNPPDQIVAYGREQSYLYMPFGADIKLWLTTKIRLNVNAEVRALLVGMNTTRFTDIGFDNDAYFTQKNGTGARISIGGEFFIVKSQAISLEAFFDYWGIGDSDIKAQTINGKFVGNYLEPKNNTKAFGVQIGYSF